MNSEEIEQLKQAIELRLPEIFSILAEAFKESSLSGNIEAEIKLNAVRGQFSDESQELADQTSLQASKPSVLSIAIEDQQVLRSASVWRKPCPDPLIAPEGCWM